MPSARSGSSAGTALGLVAVVFWGTTIPISRQLTEDLGTFTAASVVYAVAGLLACTTFLSPARRQSIKHLPRKYLLVCGSLMVLYTVLLYLALGYAPSREAVVEVTIANYLWPGLTLLFAVPILGQRMRPIHLALGLLMATGGVVMAVMGSEMTWGRFIAASHLLPVLSAALAAVCWALYSNLARRWAGNVSATGMPLFLMSAGACLLIVRCFVHETVHLRPTTLPLAAFLIVFPTLIAYVLWDYGFRRGNPTVLATASYFIPVLAILTGAVLLRLTIHPMQWFACGMVIAGSLLCRLAVRPEAQANR